MSRDDRFDGDSRTLEAANDLTTPDAGTEAEEEVIVIQENIEDTRAEMSETINAIQERLSPTNLKEQVKEQVMEQVQSAKEMVREKTIGKVEDMVHRASDAVSYTGNNLWSVIRANPIPATLVGVGLFWMWQNGRNMSSSRMREYGRYSRGDRVHEGDRYSYGRQPIGSSRAGDSTGNLASRASDTISNAAEKVQEQASHLAESARETMSGVVDTATQQYHRVEDGIETAMRENPLAVGAVAMALGAAAGLALPLTRKENQLMGEARDQIVEKAQSVAQDTMEEVQRAAERATHETGSRP